MRTCYFFEVRLLWRKYPRCVSRKPFYGPRCAIFPHTCTDNVFVFCFVFHALRLMHKNHECCKAKYTCMLTSVVFSVALDLDSCLENTDMETHTHTLSFCTICMLFFARSLRWNAKRRQRCGSHARIQTVAMMKEDDDDANKTRWDTSVCASAIAGRQKSSCLAPLGEAHHSRHHLTSTCPPPSSPAVRLQLKVVTDWTWARVARFGQESPQYDAICCF